MNLLLRSLALVSVGLSLTFLGTAGVTWSHDPGGHDQHGHHRATPQDEEASEGPIKITMEDLHKMGGVPMGWKFALPQGDLKKGRQVFVKMECYRCHTVQGETFTAEPGQAGPDLTGMGAHHPAAYFAESIMYPNRVIVLDEGHTGPDGLSTMPSYNDQLTVTQLLDLVAYLKSLQAPTGHKDMGHKH
ncbi:MAG: c-type cytochrome [Candidatus Methylomirabilales bacterium]